MKANGYTANKLESGFRIGPRGIHFLGRFLHGQVDGHFWIGLKNNGYIHGNANEHGMATGDKIVYLYPDGRTALIGHFENKHMKSARHVDITKYGCDDNGMFIATEFTESLSDVEFFYDPPTNESFGGDSKKLQDPYESKCVYPANSGIPNSGVGVFTKKKLISDKLACYFSLFIYRKPDQEDIYIKVRMDM